MDEFKAVVLILVGECTKAWHAVNFVDRQAARYRSIIVFIASLLVYEEERRDGWVMIDG